VSPAAYMKCQRWIPADAPPCDTSKDWVDVSFDDHAEARRGGLDFCKVFKCWFIPKDATIEFAVLERFPRVSEL
jgi:hypothetical protein